MLTRILTALVSIAVFITVVYFLPPVCFLLAVAAICALVSYELTWRSGIVKVPALSVISGIFATVTPLFISVPQFEKYIFAFFFAAMVAVFVVWLFNFGKASLVMALAAFFGGVVLPAMFSVIVRIRMLENGEYIMLIPFIAAWVTDSGAYFTGVFLGKHKLCKDISPKKTVEGAIGGLFFCVISVVIYSVAIGIEADLIVLAAGSLVLSVLSQAGDLSFSIIKREYNIKDYGNIFPGHGGVLDRFDSTMFTIPASYIMLMIIGVIV